MKELTMKLNGRARTLLQSFDTARFQKLDDSSQAASSDEQQRARINRSLDTAHARTEVLSAMLMGYEIVIPAGVAADCIAFIDLFDEVMAGRDAIAAKSPYRPFRMGLERKFAPGDDATGYDYYLDDFAENYDESLVQLGVAQGLAPTDESIKSQSANIKALVHLFKRRDFTTLDKARPNFGAHMERVHIELCDKKRDMPIVAQTNAFSELNPRYFPEKFAQYQANIADREGVELDRVARMVATSAQVAARLPNPRQRGQWYKRQKDFGDMWSEARTWLDHGLYDVMAKSFGVSVPSYFCQQTHDDLHSEAVALAFIDEPTFRRFRDDWADIKWTSPPVASAVVWTDIWHLITEPDFVESTKSLQSVLARAYAAEARKLTEIEAKYGIQSKDPEKQTAVARAAQKRDDKVKPAIANHVEFINKGQTGLLFRSTDDGLIVQTGPRPPLIGQRGEDIAQLAARTGIVPALATAFGLDGSLEIDPKKGLLGFILLSLIRGKIEDGRDAIVRSYVSAGIEKINRSSLQIFGQSEHLQMTNAMQDQVNLWIKPHFTGL